MPLLARHCQYIWSSFPAAAVSAGKPCRETLHQLRRLSSSLRMPKIISAADAGAGDAAIAALGLARFSMFEKSGVAVVEIFQFCSLNLLADKPFNGFHMARVLGHH